MQLKLNAATCLQLREFILAARGAIRYERSQLGDDRCWLDLYRIFAVVGIPEPAKLPAWPQMKERCTDFFRRTQRRKDPRPVRKGALTDPAHWNDDLERYGRHQPWLRRKASQLKRNILEFYAIWLKRQPTYLDYERLLYSVMPERLHADTRLPPEAEFLGEAKSPCAGCPAFHRSHGHCDSAKICDIHVWGRDCPAQVVVGQLTR